MSTDVSAYESSSKLVLLPVVSRDLNRRRDIRSLNHMRVRMLESPLMLRAPSWSWLDFVKRYQVGPPLGQFVGSKYPAGNVPMDMS